jgi:hypothetical protein
MLKILSDAFWLIVLGGIFDIPWIKVIGEVIMVTLSVTITLLLLRWFLSKHDSRK